MKHTMKNTPATTFTKVSAHLVEEIVSKADPTNLFGRKGIFQPLKKTNTR